MIKLIIGVFLVNSLGALPVQAEGIVLPKPGVMVHLSPAYESPILKGIRVQVNNPFQFDFIATKGDSNKELVELEQEYTRLIKYFLTAITIPEKDLWVNLSPYEKDRIVPDIFGQTEMGRDLLAEDYLLKQITASLTYPEKDMGKKFWQKVYQDVAKTNSLTNIPVNSLNKVWIVPEKAVVYEKWQEIDMEGESSNEVVAYVVESKLKVMLEEDYLGKSKQLHNLVSKDVKAVTGTKVIKEIIIPALEKEVNEGKNFARLRQVYNSLILANWYKRKLRKSILFSVYSDKRKAEGLLIDDNNDSEKIYQLYIQAFKKGVYNYIKEEESLIDQKVLTRKYFSGGVGLTSMDLDRAMSIEDYIPADKLPNNEKLAIVTGRIDAVLDETKGVGLLDFLTTDNERLRRIKSLTAGNKLLAKVAARFQLTSNYKIKEDVGRNYANRNNDYLNRKRANDDRALGAQWKLLISRQGERLQAGGWRMTAVKNKEFIELDKNAEIISFVHPEFSEVENVEIEDDNIVIFASSETALKNLYAQVEYILKELKKEYPIKMKAYELLEKLFISIEESNVLPDGEDKIKVQQKIITMLENAYLAGANAIGQGDQAKEHIGKRITQSVKILSFFYLGSTKKIIKKISKKNEVSSGENKIEEVIREAYRKAVLSNKPQHVHISSDDVIDKQNRRIKGDFILPNNKRLSEIEMTQEQRELVSTLPKYESAKFLKMNVIPKGRKFRIIFSQEDVKFTGQVIILRQWDISDNKITVVTDEDEKLESMINKKLEKAFESKDQFITIDVTKYTGIDRDRRRIDDFLLAGKEVLRMSSFNLNDNDLTLPFAEPFDQLEVQLIRIDHEVVFFFVGYKMINGKLVPFDKVSVFIYSGGINLSSTRITYQNMIDYKLRTAVRISTPTEIDLSYYHEVDLIEGSTKAFPLGSGDLEQSNLIIRAYNQGSGYVENGSSKRNLWRDQKIGFKQGGWDSLKVSIVGGKAVFEPLTYTFKASKTIEGQVLSEQVEWEYYKNKMEFLSSYYRPRIINEILDFYKSDNQSIEVTIYKDDVRNLQLSGQIKAGFPLPDGTVTTEDVNVQRSEAPIRQIITISRDGKKWLYKVRNQISHIEDDIYVEDISNLVFENGQFKVEEKKSNEDQSTIEIENSIEEGMKVKEGESSIVEVTLYNQVNTSGGSVIKPGFRLGPNQRWGKNSDNFNQVLLGRVYAKFERYQEKVYITFIQRNRRVCFVERDGDWVYSSEPELLKGDERKMSIKDNLARLNKVIKAVYQYPVGERITLDLTNNPAISRKILAFKAKRYPLIASILKENVDLRLLGGFKKLVKLEGEFSKLPTGNVQLRLIATVEDNNKNNRLHDIIPVFEISEREIKFIRWEGTVEERLAIMDKIQEVFNGKVEKVEIQDVSTLIADSQSFFDIPNTHIEKIPLRMNIRNTRTSLKISKAVNKVNGFEFFNWVYSGYQFINGQEVLVDTSIYRSRRDSSYLEFSDYIDHLKEERNELKQQETARLTEERQKAKAIENAVDVQIQRFLEIIDQKDIILLFSRYGLDVRNILWGILGAQLGDKFDAEKINQVLGEKIWKVVQDQADQTTGAVINLTPFGSKNEQDESSQMVEGIRKVGGFLQNIIEKMGEDSDFEKEKKVFVERNAVIFLKKLEEIHFFKRFYRELPDEDIETEAKRAIEEARMAETVPIVKEALELLLSEISEAVNISNILKSRGLKGLNLYQLIAVMRLLKDKRKLLADEMGLGKTLETLGSFLATDAKEMVVLGPNQVLGRWLDDIIMHLDTDLELVILAPDFNLDEQQINRLSEHGGIVIDKNASVDERVSLNRKYKITIRHVTERLERNSYLYNVREEPLANKRRIVLMNYEVLPNVERYRKEMGLSQLKTGFLALDEVHFLKRETNVTSEAVFGSKKDGVAPMEAEYRMLITGTPLENEIDDLLVYLIYLSTGGESWEEKFFENMDRKKFSQFFKVKDMEKNALLHNYLVEVMIRRLKEDVVKGLPQKVPKVAKLDPVTGTMKLGDKTYKLEGDFSKQMAIYEEALSDPNGFELRYAKVREKRLNVDDNSDEDNELLSSAPTTQLLRMEQVAVDPQIFGLNIDNIAFESVRVLLRDYHANGKNVLVFAEQSSYLEDLKNYLGEEFKSRLGYMDGDIAKFDRMEAVRRFQSGENNVFLLSIGTGGVGINLTNADAVIFLDHPWKPSRLHQAIDRAHRRDNQRNMPGKMLDIITMEWDVPVSIGALKAKLLLRKQIIINMITNGQLDPILLDAYESLESSLIDQIEEAKSQVDVRFDAYEQNMAKEFYDKLTIILAKMRDGDGDQQEMWDELATIYSSLLEHKSSFIAARAELQLLSSAIYPDLKRSADKPLEVLDLFSGPSVLKRAYTKDINELQANGLHLSITDYDISEQMLMMGLQEGGQIQGNVNQLNQLPENSRDVVNLAYGFRLAKNPAQMMRDIHRILRDKGHFVLVLPPNNNLSKNFMDALESIGFEADSRQVIEGQRGDLVSRMESVTYRQLEAEFGREFADDLAGYVNRKFTILIASKTRSSDMADAVTDQDFIIDYQKPPINKDKVKRLSDTAGRMRLVPEIVRIDGEMVWNNEGVGGFGVKQNEMQIRDYNYHTLRNSLRKLATYINRLSRGNEENRSLAKTRKWQTKAEELFQLVVDDLNEIVKEMEPESIERLKGDFDKFMVQPYVITWLRQDGRDHKVKQAIALLDKAQVGGIDLSASNFLQVKSDGQDINWEIEMAEITQLENALGLVPVVIDIQPLNNLESFLGLQSSHVSY